MSENENDRSTRTRRSFLRGTATTGAAVAGLSAPGAAAGSDSPPGDQPVLLVHGYADTKDSPWWEVVTKYLREVGYTEGEIYVLDLGDVPGTTTDSPREYAEEVKAKLEAVSDQHGSEVDIVGHSMGGLDSRWCIEKLDGAGYVDDLITLGTPHQGTYAAYLGHLTDGGRDMQPGSDFLEELNDGTLAEGVDYNAFWSSTDELIDPNEYASLPSPEDESVEVAHSTNSGHQEHMQLVFDRAVFEQYYRRLD